MRLMNDERRVTTWQSPLCRADLALRPTSGLWPGKFAGVIAAIAHRKVRRQGLTIVSILVRSARLGWPVSFKWKAAATGMGSLMPAGTGAELQQLAWAC